MVTGKLKSNMEKWNQHRS